MDDYGHIDPKLQLYLLCNYLEKLNDNEKGVLFHKSKKNVFIYKESIMYPFVELNQIAVKKKINFFIVTIDILKF